MIQITQAEHDAFKATVAERDRLRELLDWRPIESAPKDMHPVLLFVDGFCVQAFADATGVLNAQSGVPPHWRKLRGKPTHWMPLPAPPKVAP